MFRMESRYQMVRMALSLQPPPPPPAPLSYSPPSEEDISAFERHVARPLTAAIDNYAVYLQELEETPNESNHYFMATWILEILGGESSKPVWPILYPPSRFEDNLLRHLRCIQDKIKQIPHHTTPARPPPPAPVVDVTPVVVAMDEKIKDFKRETAASLRSFADAVKASSPITPSPTTPLKNFKPPSKSGQLPQAVIRYHGDIKPENRPSFAELTSRINRSLHNHHKHLHVRVVGVKWTSASNLLVRAQAPSPSSLVAALKAVHSTLIDQHLAIRDIIPNTRWSRMTLSHVHSGKETKSPTHSPTTLHEELIENNPRYAALTIRQLPNWIRNPGTFKDGQISSISFVFEDPDGTLAQQLSGTSLTAFGNLRCTLKTWITPKKTLQKN